MRYHLIKEVKHLKEFFLFIFHLIIHHPLNLSLVASRPFVHNSYFCAFRLKDIDWNCFANHELWWYFLFIAHYKMKSSELFHFKWAEISNRRFFDAVLACSFRRIDTNCRRELQRSTGGGKDFLQQRFVLLWEHAATATIVSFIFIFLRLQRRDSFFRGILFKYN